MTSDNAQLDTKEIIKLINASPLTEEDKAHWLEMLPKLTIDQKERLTHSIKAKTDIASAKAAIDRALAIIDQAEAEAESDLAEPDVKETALSEAKEELTKEIDANNPMMPTDDLVTVDQLEQSKTDADSKLKDLRQELAALSQEATGSTPPSYQQQ